MVFIIHTLFHTTLTILVQNVYADVCVIIISHKQLCHEVYYAFDVEVVLCVLLHTNTGK